ncbi:hypothetical protein PP571_06145 [Mycobacteroides abscessus]|uniref:Uncharacterized protein n=1 Tax=Mycobacteroides immunogenum TaxID=83262 RepID=A0A7V8RUU9_9MYCO|nr:MULTISPECIES: hypothetical protein [Mycobacteroides]ANO03704.1 hypothetical protein BAB75_10230 [Mycobacteroides immunogenum]KIU38183.1 hypothetical protein TL11_23550 [Mycobacteroides immunogenum]KPG04570.1 hypothetical protein AN909_22660 [Mycobacteroides immunogenum]KPG05291.1 hypothetical protein AN908_22920 [Mycobacteroides immunogenum]KPG06158.1 hypothetical protein AN910_22400 [Mycobacteroides immunogenum]
MSPPTIPAELTALLDAEPTAQRGFPWDRQAWQKQVHDLPDVLGALGGLPDRVNRDHVRTVVLSELNAGRVLPAFASAMVWGYGDRGYGPTRVRWILTGTRGGNAVDTPVLPTASDRLAEAADVVRSQGPVAGFRFMNNSGRIKYLGPAFFTKWLYFVSAVDDVNSPEAAPILDKQVIKWIREHTEISLNLNRTSAYESYLNLLEDWGRPYNRTPVQVEKAIFGLQTGRD